MKNLILIGCVAVAGMQLCAVEQKGCGERTKREADRFIAEAKTVGLELGKRLSPAERNEGKVQQKNVKVTVTARHVEQSAIIVESCEHCKHLCDNRYQEEQAHELV